uniref:Nuclear receptor domain-containing protein n=1 Tax=Heterorhabditis bacteriophora TaxID=37862 RepID=A0A1I7WQ68_HETBA
MHYGAIACVGCKGFFRRALMKADQLECQAHGNCPISVDQRTSCRSCRFQKCLYAGMKPEGTFLLHQKNNIRNINKLFI